RIYGGPFSMDNRYLAFNQSSQFSRVYVFDLEQKQVVQTFEMRRLIPNNLHISNVDALSFLHADSRFLVTAGMDVKMRLWDIQSGRELSNYEPEDMAEPQDGELIFGLSKLGAGGVSLVAVAPNDQYFVAATKQNLSTWVLRDFVERQAKAIPMDSITAVEIHPKSDLLTIAYTDGRIVERGKTSQEDGAELQPPGPRITSIRSINEQKGLARLANGELLVFDRKQVDAALRIQPPQEYFCAVANEQYLFTVRRFRDYTPAITDTLIQAWSISTGEPVFTLRGFPSGVHDLAISPNGQYLAVAGYRRPPRNDIDFDRSRIQIWSVAERKVIREILAPDEYLIFQMRFSEDSHRLLYLTENHTINMVEVNSGAHLWQMQRDPTRISESMFNGAITLLDFGKPIRAQAQQKVLVNDQTRGVDAQSKFYIETPESIANQHPIEEQILIGYSGGNLLLIDLKLSILKIDPKAVHQPLPHSPYVPWYERTDQKMLEQHQGPILDAQVLADRKTVFSIGRDQQFKSLDFYFEESGIPVFQQWTNTRTIRQAQFQETQQQLLIGRENGAVLQWKMGQADPVVFHKSHQEPVCALALSPDGDWLVSCDESGQTYLKHLSTEQQYVLDEGNRWSDTVFDWFLFSPNGKYLLGSAYNNDKLFLWEVQTRQLIREVLAGGSISDVAFSADASHLLVAYGDYELDPGMEKINLNYFRLTDGEMVHTSKQANTYVHAFQQYNEGLLAWFVEGDRLIARQLIDRKMKILLDLPKPQAPLEKIRYLPAQKQVVVVEGQYAYLWNEGTGERVDLTEHEQWQLKRRNLLEDSLALGNGYLMRLIPRSLHLYDQRGESIYQRFLTTPHRAVYFSRLGEMAIWQNNEVIQWLDVLNNQCKGYTYFP
ncbi:MAG: hypothetical protein AAGD05_10415, partial [Bacteroidota bacterium]